MKLTEDSQAHRNLHSGVSSPQGDTSQCKKEKRDVSGKGGWFQRLENTWKTQGVHQKLALCEEDVRKSDLDKLIKASNNNNMNGGTLGVEQRCSQKPQAIY